GDNDNDVNIVGVWEVTMGGRSFDVYADAMQTPFIWQQKSMTASTAIQKQEMARFSVLTR
ncbi:MAG: hypothetical protein NC219_01645, partial [Prevotella sp.]|nr:hypothetical protein [Prevotella sp.]